MKQMIEGYRSYPGEHCGSVAMRGLLAHYCGLELTESVVFGLGAGIDCMYVKMPGVGAVAFGRTASMEVDLGRALGVDYVETPQPDDDKAWQEVREEVIAGRPTMLSGDIFYLDYRDYKVHFPGHRFVLLGFDDEKKEVYIADRIREEAETCSLGALMESRNPKGGMSTQNLWGRFASGRVGNDLMTASRTAIELCARRMLGLDEASSTAGPDPIFGDFNKGISGIKLLAEELPGWAEMEGARGLARYNASAIEKFGNGGGNFRRLYAGFLSWAHAQDKERVPGDAAALSTRAADGWTALAGLLWKASDGENTWSEASTRAKRIADVEQRLFEGLAEGCEAAV
jgi:hypothetical protein